MISYLFTGKKSDCTGCEACMNICPQDAITMEYDKEGFFYPSLNKALCIPCGFCQKVCLISHNLREKDFFSEPLVFAGWSKNEDMYLKSSSGGIFPELANAILSREGIVFGAAFHNFPHLEIRESRNKKDIQSLQGSKYLPARVNTVYRKIKKDLEDGNPVLFSGTPCQVSGLNAFVQDENLKEHLLTIEVICHGVPSPLIFKAYLSALEAKYKAKATSINFRDKENGWLNYSVTVKFDNGKKYSSIHHRDLFCAGFLKNIYLRPSCYHCPFASLPRQSDITLGDFWGVPTQYFQKMGVSVICCNSYKGLNEICNLSGVEIHQVSLSTASASNSRLVNGSYEIPPFREKYFQSFNKIGFEKTMRKYLIKSSPLQLARNNAIRLYKLIIHLMRK